MNRDQWNGTLKQLKGFFKKRWGRLRGDSLLETMGEVERLFGVFQRQYGSFKAREGRENRRNASRVTSERPRQEHGQFVLIEGRKRSRHVSRWTRNRARPLKVL